MGEAVSENRVARLTHLAGIQAQIGYKKKPGHYGGKPSVVVDNTLDRQFAVDTPDRAWVVCAKEGSKMRDAACAASFEHGERIVKEISRTTREGMARRRADGARFGNPAIRTSVQPLGAATWSDSADAHVRRIADVLREQNDPYGLAESESALNTENNPSFSTE